MEQERQAFTIREICAAYGICRATAYNEINRGRLRAVKLAAKTMILRDDARKWAESRPIEVVD